MAFESIHARSRDQVLRRLTEILPGKELSPYAETHGITIEKNGRVNKGWVGLTVERMASLDFSNRPEKDGFDFELKTTRVYQQDGIWAPKETIKVTQLNPQLILEEEFESSTLWNKLQRFILVGCYYEAPTRCQAISISAVDIQNPELKEPIRAFWEDVRHTVASGEMGEYINLGNSEDLIQLRPTGNGKLWSTCPITGEKFPSRAFYATKKLLRQVMR